MRVCMILEGCYPYVYGGVSSWTHNYIQAMPEVEFVLWCIGAKASQRGKYKFELPKNVVEVHEVFLDDALRLKMDRKRFRLNAQEKDALIRLFQCEKTDWDMLFSVFQERQINPVSLLMSKDFLDMLIEICHEKYPYISFADYFYTVRSMMLPELYLMTQEVPRADLYHATATGYGGLLASLGKWKYNKPMILTEHGIYTREREEELLRANWVLPYFRQQWIDLFYTFSDCAYGHADYVTSLFHRASHTQAELGCVPGKLRVIENGIRYERFEGISLKEPDEWIDIGAVVRIAKIKDIKTMIYAFAEVKAEVPNARLHIMGDVDDEEYFEECKLLIEQLEVKDIIFTGVVNVIEYMVKIDFTILTSISEGQPLSVLESFAAQRACVTTDVGCCKELLEDSDGFGEAGICVPPMHKERLAQAMVQLCREPELRLAMGKAGQKRAAARFTHEISMNKYKKLYQEAWER